MFIGFFLFFFFLQTKAEKNIETDLNELEDEDTAVKFIPRAQTYLSYQFARFKTKPKEKDFLYWRDFGYQDIGDKDLELTRDYQLANPNFRGIVKSFEKNDKNKVVQLFLEPGLPFEIPCMVSSNPESAYPVFHVIEDRLGSMMQKSKNSTPFLEKIVKIINTTIDFPDNSQLVQIFGMNNGRSSIGKDFVTLQIHRPSQHIARWAKDKVSIPHLDDIERFSGKGLSLKCHQIDTDDKPRLSDVLINADVLYNKDHSFHTYGQYEVLNNSKVSHEDAGSNVKLEVHWEPFSCCSACCCPPDLCVLFPTSRECDRKVFSVKVRKGHLSLKKLDASKKVKLSKPAEDVIESLLSMEPYKTTGIPIFSSILDGIVDTAWTTFRQNLLDKFLSQQGSNFANYNGVGIYVEEMSCNNDPQKTNCSLLAECRGIVYQTQKKGNETEDDGDVDPCNGEELNMFVMSEKRSSLNIETDKSYRLQVDKSLYRPTMTISWKFGLKPVTFYDENKPCMEQGVAVHPNGKDLLLTGIGEQLESTRVEATLPNGQKMVVVLSMESENESQIISSTTSVVIWTCLIIIFLVLLLAFIIVVDKKRMARTERTLQKQREEDDPSHQSTNKTTTRV